MPRTGSLIRGTGIATIAAFVLTACGGDGYNQESTTKVLQSVSVDLDSDAAITEVGGSAVYLDETSGESNSSENSFEVEDVVDDLPVRVTTQYETHEGSGTNLEDLEGHSGRVEIDVTLENLTLTSSDLTYDVAGESRESPALVGTPLSVAGSVELAGIQASEVVSDPESESSTNGVVSQTSEGDAVVQWGTVLAPPQSEATTTFQLVADVDDFDVPDIDIAVQAGFHTDMSFEGQVASAFDRGESSEYARQQNAIELVADVNDVLTRAGTTITDIRTTLDNTTETLGVDAAEQLRQNSDDMVAEMERVGEQLTALESQVEGSLTGAESSMNSQLSQIVSSMNGMMGNTDANPPQLLQGEGCAATAEDAESNNSLYSTFLVLGAQLDAYAQGNAECRDEVVSEIERTLGPEQPTNEVCTPSADDEEDAGDQAASITCTLFNAQVSVQESLNELVDQGKQNVQELVDEKVTGGAIEYSDAIEAKLDDIREQLDNVEDRDDKWDAVEESIEDIESIGDDLDALYEHGKERLSALEGHTESIKGQQSKIARQLCRLIDDADSPDELDREGRKINSVHEDLVGNSCVEESDVEPSPEPSDDASDGVTEEPSDDPSAEPSEEPSDGSGEPSPTPSASETGEPTDEPGGTPGEDDEPTDGDTEAPTTESVAQIIPSPGEEPTDDSFDDSLNGQMEQHLEDEQAAWEELLGEIGYDSEEGKFKEFEASLENLKDSVEAARTGVNEEAKAVDEVLNQIDEALGTAENDDDRDLVSLHEKLDESLADLETNLVEQTNHEFDEFEEETSEKLPEDVDRQVRIVTDRVNSARDSVVASYNSTIAGLATTSDAVINDTSEQIEEQQSTLETQQDETTSALNESTTAVIEGIHQSTASSTRDLEGASAQLGDSLNNVILDLGDPDVQGSGILGSMSASSALSDTADYQLALASQRAAGYANVRSEDIAEIMLRQAQFSASLEAAATLPAFHLDVPSGARSQTIYSFTVSGGDA